jgi:hypothetical protein
VVESPETVRRPDVLGELNISLCCMTEEQEGEGEGAEPVAVYRAPPPIILPGPVIFRIIPCECYGLSVSLGIERLETAGALIVSERRKRI